MRTPINVMIEPHVLVKLDQMAAANGKTRTGMVVELVTGTSKSSLGLQRLVQAWFDECVGVEQEDVDRLIKMLTS